VVPIKTWHGCIGQRKKGVLTKAMGFGWQLDPLFKSPFSSFLNLTKQHCSLWWKAVFQVRQRGIGFAGQARGEFL
jgi:hypothetical protein